MAIVDMNRISVIGLASDREKILELLMKLEAVQMTDIWDELKDDVKKVLLRKEEKKNEIAALEEEIVELEEVLRYLGKYDRRKKGLFESRRIISREDYEEAVQNQQEIRDAAKSVAWCEEQIAGLHMEKNKCTNRIISMKPWEQVDIPLDYKPEGSVLLTFGYAPRRCNVAGIEKQLDEEAALCEIFILNRDREHTYMCAVYHRSEANKSEAILKRHGFIKLDFTGLKDTAAKTILKDSERILEIEKEYDRFIKVLEGYAEGIDRIELLYDALVTKRDLKICESRLPGTNNTFMLRGWIPAHLSEYIEKELSDKWVCSIQIRKPSVKEDYPVLLRNKSIGQSVESITMLYSAPNPREADPNTVTGIFFILFFGLMMGDAGYGAVMIIAAALLLKKNRLEEGMRRFMKLMLYCGISAVFWGAMLGGWFGIPFMSEYALLLNPIDNPETFLGFTLILGITHIFIGIGMNCIKLIKKKKFLDILLDVVTWYIFFTGFVFVILPYAYSGRPEAIEGLVDIGKYMLVVGGATIALTRSRDSKKILKKLISGFGSLYGIVKFLSDVLSYSRLMALGLATSVIGVIVYDIACLIGLDSPISIAGFILVMLAGHTLNFGIAVLSAYVHSSRLQYIEFFSRFYIGNGVVFKPFRSETKYIKLQEVMNNEYGILRNDR